ncbi:MAG: MBL fold metallo-hydrolase [Candidatus Brocadiia bacterium]
MFLKPVKSEGLAHISYILGDGASAAVIDPRRDVHIYLEIAARRGTRITHIFETHRNEDYVIGSVDLAEHTGAEIHHGGALDFQYGSVVSEGDVFDFGDIRLRVLETPGHTFESISLVMTDTNFGDDPVGVFTGDALFIGDVGRTDFFPDRAREVAGMLYDSIFEKLLPLGDQTILYPAHGAGSVCGESMASREFSTLGLERKNNPVLQKTGREEFIDYKVNEKHYQPPYFRQMEKYNLEGAPPLAELPRPVPLTPDDVDEATERGAVLVDLRSPEAFAGAFIPDSLAIPLEMVPAYAGYLLDCEQELMLIPETREQVRTAVRYLIRMGYDRIPGYLEGGVHAWEVSGRRYDRIDTLHAKDLERRLEEDSASFTLLDVRKVTEYEEGHLEGSTHIFLGNLQDRIEEIPPEKPVVTFCGSGERAVIAASILKKHGFRHVEDNLGSMAACANIGCTIQKG